MGTKGQSIEIILCSKHGTRNTVEKSTMINKIIPEYMDVMALQGMLRVK